MIGAFGVPQDLEHQHGESASNDSTASAERTDIDTSDNRADGRVGDSRR